MKKFKEICDNCSFSFGSHRADDGMCPATEGGVDFAYGSQTKFKPTGEYIGVEERQEQMETNG